MDFNPCMDDYDSYYLDFDLCMDDNELDCPDYSIAIFGSTHSSVLSREKMFLQYFYGDVQTSTAVLFFVLFFIQFFFSS